MTRSEALLTLREAAEAARVSPLMLQRRIRSGHLRAERDEIGRWLVRMRDVAQLKAHPSGRKPVQRLAWLRAIGDGIVRRSARSRWTREDTGDICRSHVRTDILALGLAEQRIDGRVNLTRAGRSVLEGEG